MVTLLITSVLILGLVALALYFWQKPRVSDSIQELPPPPEPRGLFIDPSPARALESSSPSHEVLRESLVAQARQGDKSTLPRAHELNNRAIYDEVLTALVNANESDANILSLTSHVTRNEWPVNKALAIAFIAACQKNPARSLTAKMLHIAALSDDAETYRNAVELALSFWREGKLEDVSSIELNSLLNGEFWVLSSTTRSSGAGFVLKRSLASARRELEQTTTAK